MCCSKQGFSEYTCDGSNVIETPCGGLAQLVYPIGSCQSFEGAQPSDSVYFTGCDQSGFQFASDDKSSDDYTVIDFGVK